MNINTPRTRQYTLTFVTIMILVLGFSYYFFIYVKDKQQQLHEMGFRIISKVGENIIAKKDSYIKNAKNIVREGLPDQLEDEKDLMDSVLQKINTKKHNRDIEIINIESWDTSKLPYFPLLTSQPISLEITDSVVNTISKNAFIYTFRIDLANFIDPLVRTDLFDDFLILNDSYILYKTITAGLYYQNSDSLLNRNLGFQLSTIKDLKIGGISYKLFLQPLQVDQGNSWILGGLITEAKYNSYSMEISPILIVILFLIAALTILSLPFLKLLSISPLERLNLSDALFAGLSMILGSSILVLILFHGHRNWGPDGERNERQLASLADSISANLLNEVEKACDQLSKFDTIITDSVNIIRISSNTTAVKENNDTVKYVAEYYPLFSNLFWTDSSGDQRIKWTTGEQNTPKINISKRDYFRNNLNGKAWTVDSIIFAMESIYSWNTGLAMAGIGKISNYDNMAVVAMSTVLYSVIDPILPQGFGFAIIDDSGKVWFHSRKDRNLQENFFEETEDNNRLRSSIFGHSETFTRVKYLGKDHNVYVKPIKGLSLFVVAFRDREYDKIVNAEIINFTFILIVFYFLSFAFMALFTRILKMPASKLKRISFFYGWLWPVEKKKKSYVSTFFTHLLAILLLIIFDVFNKHLVHSLLLLFTASINSFLFTFFNLNSFSPKNFFKQSNYIFVITVIVFFLLVIGFSVYFEYWQLIGFQIILLAIYFIDKERLAAKLNLDYRKSYVLMLLSWLFITSVIPSIFFYRIAYQQEHELALKHSQLEMARTLESKKDMIFDSSRLDYFRKPTSHKGAKETLINRGDIYTAHFFDSLYFKKPDTVPSWKRPNKKDALLTLLNSSIRPFYNQIVIEKNDLVFDIAVDERWNWKKDVKKSTGSDILTFSFKSYIHDRDLVIKSSLPVYSLPRIFTSNNSLEIDFFAVTFWALFILMIIGFYYLIKFTVTRIFYHRIFKPSLLEIDDKLFQRDIHNNIFLIGLPQSGKSSYLNNLYIKDDKMLTIDLIELAYGNGWQKIQEKAKNKNVDLIIVDHFEYNIESREFTHKKLELLDQLLLLKEKKIIVTSSIHLSNIEELYKNGKNNASDQEAGQEIFRWPELFSNFYEIYYRLQDDKTVVDDIYDKNPSPLINSLVQDEFNHGFYLKELKPKIVDLIEKNEEEKVKNDYDQIIFKIQSLSTAYYHSLWSTCSKKEKYVIYDLAQDGLVNPRNFQTIDTLLNKGLIIFKDTLRVMNESFRNFVLTAIKPEEALQMEKEVREIGIWNKFRNPLIIVLLAVTAFIFITQKEGFNNIISYLTAFLAIIPILIKVGAIFSAKPSVPAKD